MNLNIKKISTLAGVGVISILSTFQPLTNAQAALTPPSNYDIAYISNGSNFNLIAPGYTPNSTIPLFTRTSDGAFFNYTHNFSSGQHSNTANFDLPDGLDITMIFNRSNTSWTDASPAGFTGYYATDTKIGSDSTVGSISKTNLIFNNQTNKDYRLILDFSSTLPRNTNFLFELQYSNINYGTWANNFIRTDTNNYINFLIPSFTTSNIFLTNNSVISYFDAWYLQDLGVSASYQEGFDIGQAEGYADGLGNNPNILLNGFQAMVGILVNFMLLILNLEAFGVSILSVFGVLAFFVGVIWFFKLLRG